MKTDKKGITYQMVLWIPKLIYLIIVLVVSFGLIYLFTSNEVDVGDVEAHVIMHSHHYSPEGISKFDDDTKRVYSGIVDRSRFTRANLESALNSDENSLAMKLVGRKWENLGEDSDDSGEDSDIRDYEIFLNYDTYRKWIPLADLINSDAKVEVPQIFSSKEVRYINYEGSDSRDRAVLETTVIMPNE